VEEGFDGIHFEVAHALDVVSVMHKGSYEGLAGLPRATSLPSR
jgi:hypothetical protein